MKRFFSLILFMLIACMAAAPVAGLAESGGASAEGRSNILVVYFSCTGTTRAIAEQAAEILRADLYEIVPREPYSEADLNYRDNDSRSTQEMSDASVRPTISGSVEGMENYEMILLGYPIWWGEAPRIVATFLESYDFTGKTIAPFCTSGGSGIGASDDQLRALLDETATWLEGVRLSSGADGEEVRAWLEQLGMDGAE